MEAAAVFSLIASQVGAGRQLAAEFGLPHFDLSGQALEKARQVARHIRAQLAIKPGADAPQFVFLLDAAGLSLARLDADNYLNIRADFHSPSVRYRRQKGGGKSQMIARAVGLGAGPPPQVLAATAGLGRDAFVLASLGCTVTMVERVPEVRALLAAALAAAAEWGECHDPGLPPILRRMRLIGKDALTQLAAPDAAPDVVYLDPMFPPRNKSALVKKEMRVFHDLVGTDPDAAGLLPAAQRCAAKRVVVKRPRVAPILAGLEPSYALEGKSNRFDVYLCQSLLDSCLFRPK